jgi:hypothetical protein
VAENPATGSFINKNGLLCVTNSDGSGFLTRKLFDRKEYMRTDVTRRYNQALSK